MELPTVNVVRVTQTTILDDMGNPVRGFIVMFRIAGLPDTYNVQIAEATANKDVVNDAVKREALRIWDLHQLEG
jgi:hypothetical protein